MLIVMKYRKQGGSTFPVKLKSARLQILSIWQLYTIYACQKNEKRDFK
jgi:hypothetical protein